MLIYRPQREDVIFDLEESSLEKNRTFYFYNKQNHTSLAFLTQIAK